MTALSAQIDAALGALADPERAEGNNAYLKVAENGTLPMIGVRRPDVRRTVRALAQDHDDEELLAEVIEPNRGDREFLVRKAIGWSLREVARQNPDWVRSYVASHDLSTLSRREALKHLS